MHDQNKLMSAISNLRRIILLSSVGLRSLTPILLSVGGECGNVFGNVLITKTNTAKRDVFLNSYEKCVLRPDQILQVKTAVILRENFKIPL